MIEETIPLESGVLKRVLTDLGYEMSDLVKINPRSNIICLIDLGDVYERERIKDDVEEFRGKRIIVPMEPREGQLVNEDGRKFNNYAVLPSGLIVPESIAWQSGLFKEWYYPPQNMLRYTRVNVDYL